MIRVLFVCNEPGLRDTGKNFLEKSGGMQVDFMPAAQAAHAIGEKDRYDAIVSEFPMPGMDATDVLQLASADPIGWTPAVIFISRGSDDAVSGAIDNGADFYLESRGDLESWFAGLQFRIRQAVRSRMTEAALKKENRQLILAGKKISHFESTARYNIANSLTVMRGILRQIRRHSGDSALMHKLEKTDNAGREIYRQLELARTLQEIGIECPEWHCLRKALEPVVLQAEHAGVQCSVDTGESEVCADPLFSRVFQLLLEMTIRHGNRVSALSISCCPKSGNMAIIWEEDPDQVSAEEWERIPDEGNGGDGSGLVLFVCSEILAVTGISLTETDVRGRGSRFELLVPEGRYRNV